MRLFYDVGNAISWVASAIGNVVMTIVDMVVYAVQSTVDAVVDLTSRVFWGPRIAPPPL